jgi:hypothetical protein
MTFGVTTRRGGHKMVTRHALFMRCAAGWYVYEAFKLPSTARLIAERNGQTLIPAPRNSAAQNAALRFYAKNRSWS